MKNKSYNFVFFKAFREDGKYIVMMYMSPLGEATPNLAEVYHLDKVEVLSTILDHWDPDLKYTVKFQGKNGWVDIEHNGGYPLVKNQRDNYETSFATEPMFLGVA